MFLIKAKDFDQLGECNQDFVAPALMLYNPVSCETDHSVRGTSIERERLLVLWFGQGQIEMR